MVKLSKDEIITRVRLFLDESGVNEGEFLATAEIASDESDESELDAMIEARVLEAIRYVHGNADILLLSDAPIYDIEIEAEYADIGQTVGQYKLPADCLRVCQVYYESWPRRIIDEEIIHSGEAGYSMLSDKYATGTRERPKVGQDGDDELFLYSKGDGDDKGHVKYLLFPTWEASDNGGGEIVEVCRKVVDAFFYYLAGLTCMTLGDERQGGFFQQAAELMGKEIKA